jgi:hypothetical protein
VIATATPAADMVQRLRKRFGVKKDQRGMIRVPVSRKQLPALMVELGFTRGAEIGVWRGAYSAMFCEASPSMHMLCVDPWQSYQAWLDTKNAMPVEQAAAFIEDAYQQAKARLSGLNCTIIRDFSAVAATIIPDRSLDFAYIDANHVYDAVIEDLTVWSKKVKSGGLVMGHDYRVFTNKPTIHVVAAVNAFTRQHVIDPWFVLVGDKTASFLWVNP